MSNLCNKSDLCNKSNSTLRVYSDLHLEFEPDFRFPIADIQKEDIIILAGDIVVFSYLLREHSFYLDSLKSYLDPLIQNGNMILYVSGNHEYYHTPFYDWLDTEERIKDLFLKEFPTLIFLTDEGILLKEDKIAIFGGTMWTDFNNNNYFDSLECKMRLNDYKLSKHFSPLKSVELHNNFKEKLKSFLDLFTIKETNFKDYKKVVITHHSPINKPDTKYKDLSLRSAFCSTDMLPIIEKYEPDIWIYGHTHEPDFQVIEHIKENKTTKIISNPFGYKNPVSGFDPLYKTIL